MKALPWIIAGVTIGAAVAFVLGNAPQPAYATGDPDAEDAARKTSAWGTGKRIGGTGDSLVGKAKQGLGKMTGDDKLQGEGVVDEAVGTVKDAAGQAAHAVSDTIRDFNR